MTEVEGPPTPDEAPETRYVRYVRTTALRRVLEHLPKENVAGLQASRHTQRDATNDVPLTYLRLVDRDILDFDLDYNSVIYGPFGKDDVLQVIEQTVGDADVLGLDLLLPQEFSRFMAQTFAREEFSTYRYVVHLDHYPCRRDGERNAFWADIRSFMTEEERGWMEPASLDFSYVLPDRVFRELSRTKGRVAADYKHQIDEWKRTAGSDSRIIRRAVDLSFPRDYTTARTYRWGPEERWLLERVEDF